VNVALVADGVPVFGIVYAPALGELYATHGTASAVMAKVAAELPFLGVGHMAFQAIRTRLPDPSALVAVASRSHLTPETETFLAGYKITARRDAGSSLKFCLMARGEADIYPRLGPTMAWDTAAGHAVLLAAGGMVCTLDGQQLRYGAASGGSAKDRLRNPHFVAWGRAPIPPSGR
jgi:3'-phosphoadenosine 5'-phosphosulfate (PAPS) 3'-phosphatase